MTTIFEILRTYYGKLAGLLERSELDGQSACDAISREVKRYEHAFSTALYPRLGGAPAARSIELAPIYMHRIEDAAARGRRAELRNAVDGYLQTVHTPIVTATKMQCGWVRARQLAEDVAAALARPETKAL